MTRRIAYSFFARSVLLLVLTSCVALVAAFNLLAPNAPGWIDALADALLQWAVVGGLLGGGIYATASAQPDDRLPHESLLLWALRLWMIMVPLAILSVLLNLALLLNITLLVVIGFVLVALARAGVQTRVTRIWMLGMALSILSLWSSNILWTSAYLLAAIALGYWLIRRFSLVPQVWADTSLYTVAVLLTLAGVLQLGLPLLPINLTGGLSLVGTVGAVVSAVFYLIYAAHSYKPLSTRNATHTLAAHWYALAVLLIIFGLVFLGAVLASPDVYHWTQGTDLTEARHTFTSFAVVAVILGTINQAGAELRGHNWRITGLMPFWLIAFGSIGSGLLLTMSGVVQIYLARVVNLTALEVQSLLQPLYALRLIFVVSITLGFMIYALGFHARRPFVERGQS